MCKENKNNNFIQQFLFFCVSLCRMFWRVSRKYLSGPWTSQLHCCLCRKALGFHQKYLNLCSEYERRSYRFGTTWGWVINDRIFIFVWTILLINFHSIHKYSGYSSKMHYELGQHYCVGIPEPLVQCFLEFRHSSGRLKSPFTLSSSTPGAPVNR